MPIFSRVFFKLFLRPAVISGVWRSDGMTGPPSLSHLSFNLAGMVGWKTTAEGAKAEYEPDARAKRWPRGRGGWLVGWL